MDGYLRKISKKYSKNTNKSKRKIRSKTKDCDVIILQKSSNSSKKFMVNVNGETIHFGAKGYSDYTKHKQRSRMFRYNIRHRSRENWTKYGIYSAGFWAKWILWNKPGFRDSIKDTEKRFKIKIVYKK
jgi:Na+-transporting NADH:ubiquinone oxidoreductase subunit NqrF